MHFLRPNGKASSLWETLSLSLGMILFGIQGFPVQDLRTISKERNES